MQEGIPSSLAIVIAAAMLCVFIAAGAVLIAVFSLLPAATA
jgi:hypothetical protein